ncbi:hypothetical protein scyTo_0009741, partial [Scyliorhinus torazame]|nr:hypothetical protein [Scyliorhinus torazame]
LFSPFGFIGFVVGHTHRTFSATFITFADIGPKFHLFTVGGCVISGFVCLVLGIIIGRHCNLFNCMVTAEDGSPASGEMLQFPEGSGKGNLVYAVAHTIGSTKRGMQMHKERCTEYAAVK